jgi:hypothetical protein
MGIPGVGHLRCRWRVAHQHPAIQENLAGGKIAWAKHRIREPAACIGRKRNGRNPRNRFGGLEVAPFVLRRRRTIEIAKDVRKTIACQRSNGGRTGERGFACCLELGRAQNLEDGGRSTGFEKRPAIEGIEQASDVHGHYDAIFSSERQSRGL